MCLGVPSRVVEIYRRGGLLMGKADFGGVFKEVCLEHTPDAVVGDYVIVHVGFSLSIIDEQEARQLFLFVERMGEKEV